MKRQILLIFAATIAFSQCPDLSIPGPFSTAYRTISSIPSEDETMTNSRCYYPAINDTIPAAAVPCPIISFGHGFMTNVDNYYTYAAHFASWGYICIVPTISNPVFNPNHNYRARLMITAARFIMNLNYSSTDRFFGKLDVANWAFVGHSMGGSISLLAGDRYVNYPDSLYHLGDTLRAIVALGSPQSNPATVPSRITTPYMILSGNRDNIAPWNDVRSAFWVGSSAPGAFAVIDGANHTYFTDNYGHYLTDGTATITRDQQRAIARRHMTAFLNRYCKSDVSECNFLYSFGDSLVFASYMDTVETRLPALILGENPRPKSFVVKASPNPFNSEVVILIEGASNALLTVFDLFGRVVAEITAANKGLSELSSSGSLKVVWRPSPDKTGSGVYFIRASDGERSATERIVLLK